MKLKQFKERDNKRIGIIVFTICCILLVMGVFFFRSFALFEEKKNFNVIHGTVTDPGDLYFAYYVDDEITFELPKKDSGYTLSSKSTCNNGVTVSWDYDNWSALVNYENYQKGNSSKTKCNLYFVLTASKYIEDLASTSEEIVDDETVDHNLRYVGANPNNYVSFNNELWRIIGVMNNVDDGTGKKESRIKLIRNESIGNFSWDTSSSNINDGWGVNEWSQADLMKLLNPGYESNKDLDKDGNTITVNNSLYWNRQSGTCYNSYAYATTSCNFANTGLTNDAKAFISKAVWHIGSNGTDTWNNILTTKFYELERSENTGHICSNTARCNDTVERTTKWTGIIGLIYPSDYGFATSGKVTTREACLNTVLYNWDDSNINDCKNNNWLYHSELNYWTISPTALDTTSALIFILNKDGIVHNADGRSPIHIFPTIYLKPNVKILNDGNDGSKEKPYNLSL